MAAPLAVVCVFLLTVFSAVAVGPWYVSPGGGGDCTAGNPCGSIQQAVDRASSGDTIMVEGGTYNETLVITKSVVLEGGYASGFGSRDVEQYVTTINADGASSVISVTMGCTPTIDGFTITGGTGITKTAGAFAGTMGGGVFIDGAAGTLRDDTVYDNTAYRGGGIAVYQATEVVTIQGGKVISNTATDYGGGVRVSGSEVRLVGVEVSDNGSGYAGSGLAIFGASFVTMTQLSATDNRATTYGGGLDVRGGSALISNSTFINNAAYRGGGLYFNNASSQIISVTIVSNTASFGGGGLYFNAASSSVEGGEISRNRATDATWGRGGGVYVVSGPTPATVNISGTRIMSNTTPATSSYHRGGGMFVYSSTVVLLTNVSVAGNSSYDGGGVHIRDRVNMTVRDSTASANTAVEGGGGFYTRDSSLTVYGGQISRNAVLTPTTSAGGGGLLISSGSLVVSGTAVMSNTVLTSSGFGGGLHAIDSSNVSILGAQIAGNSAQVGGGVRTSLNATLSLDSTEVRGNQAAFGAGVYVNTSPSSVLSNATVVSNTATSYAGGLYINDASVAVNGGRFSLNDGAAKGGGMYIRNSASVTVTGVGVFTNSASSGGGVYIEDSSPLLTGVSVVSNTAASSGGGVVSVNSSPTFEGGEVNSNRITADTSPQGGGLYISGGSPTVSGTLIMSNTTPLGTSGQRGAGGGIYVVGTSSSSLTGLSVRGNSSFYGGGLYLGSNTLPSTVEGGEFVGNDANQGGGIRVSQDAMTVTGADVRQNHASWGGGFSLYKTTLTVITGSTVVSNTATNTGGAMHIWDSTAAVGHGRIQANGVTSPVTGGGGGRVHLRGSWVSMSGNTFGAAREPGAEADAGVVYLTDNSQLTFDANDVAIGATSGITRAAVCADATTVMTVTNNVILNRSALPGVWVGNGGQARVVNNTLIGSKSGDTGIAVAEATATIRNNVVVSHTTGIVGSGSFVATLSNNDVWNNGLNYSGLTTGTDDISLDPEFVSASDYHLTSASPCINAGAWADAPRADHDGQPRSDCVPDIGAYESAEGKSRCKDVYLPAIMKNY